jgi:6-phosphogluconolactonase
MTAKLNVLETAEAVALAAADEFAAIATAAVTARGRCAIALSGGSTPKRLFQLLAARGAAALPWSQIDLWWGDERSVPPDHADSNYRMANQALLKPLGLDAKRVHRIPGELADHAAAAEQYEAALQAALGDPPVFDLVLLGMGPDGHTASLFPNSAALDEGLGAAPPRWVVANLVTSPLVGGTTTRLTLTAPAINAARQVRFVVAGADKAAALAAVLEGARDPHRFPSQLIRPLHGELRWLIDTAAASQLRHAPLPSDLRDDPTKDDRS